MSNGCVTIMLDCLDTYFPIGMLVLAVIGFLVLTAVSPYSCTNKVNMLITFLIYIATASFIKYGLTARKSRDEPRSHIKCPKVTSFDSESAVDFLNTDDEHFIIKDGAVYTCWRSVNDLKSACLLFNESCISATGVNKGSIHRIINSENVWKTVDMGFDTAHGKPSSQKLEVDNTSGKKDDMIVDGYNIVYMLKPL